MFAANSVFGLPIILVSGLLASTPAFSQDLVMTGGLALEHYTKYDANPSWTDVNGYVELEWKGIYGGMSFTQSNWAGEDWADIYLGYRNEVGQLSYDGYIDYIFNTDAGGWGAYVELALGLDYALTDSFSVGLDYAHRPKYSYNEIFATATYSISDTWTVDAAYGDFGRHGSHDKAWEIGTTYSFTDEASIDLRYFDEENTSSYFGLTLAWDTTIFGG